MLKNYSLCNWDSNSTGHPVSYLVTLTESDCLKRKKKKLQERRKRDENEENPKDLGFQSSLERLEGERARVGEKVRQQRPGVGNGECDLTEADTGLTSKSPDHSFFGYQTGVSFESNIIPNKTAQLNRKDLEMQSEKIGGVNANVLRRWREVTSVFSTLVHIFCNRHD